ncbi:hypothetical protein CWR48_15755 [Oceanobacillus arenosus]|uniref:Lipoprotein n=1 Tax=Oceanobacillus arenosus TaxID=1229153 RepID=A0A3D8PK98_9BACI|nr:hypothetical protein [Oceanobacillus arenosus]RDW16500.1 hypothetical protein CWR48_15755 [Oceanobacillus arenosus]
MKKVSFLLLGLILLAACGTAEKESKPAAQMSAVSNNSIELVEVDAPAEEKEVVDIPTERTVDTGPNYPWQNFSTGKIEELQQSGETVYLFSDAEEFEDALVKSVTREYEEHVDVDQTISIFANYLDLFIQEVSPVVDNQEYFDKMQEVEETMIEKEYEQVPDLIEEAKTLRESE